MLSGIFGKDNDILLILILFLVLSGDFGKGGGFGGIFDDNIIIWIIILFFLFGDDRKRF